MKPGRSETRSSSSFFSLIFLISWNFNLFVMRSVLFFFGNPDHSYIQMTTFYKTEQQQQITWPKMKKKKLIKQIEFFQDLRNERRSNLICSIFLFNQPMSSIFIYICQFCSTPGSIHGRFRFQKPTILSHKHTVD